MSIKIEYIEEVYDVYDITVEDNHNFYANDILVHNCTEISLFSDHDHTFTCVLGSMNAATYDLWKDTDAVFVATVFLDCVAQEFIEMGSKIKGLEKAVRATEKGRALGLGLFGFHTYLQDNMIPFESFDAHMINNQIFAKLDDDSKAASKWMAELWGEPEWCRGFGYHNTHRLAVAPNTSSALLCGGVSQSCEPVIELVYNQTTSAGEIFRINPSFLKIMKSKNKYNKKTINDIIDNNGSCQHADWLSEEEKVVFKTAFEIGQDSILRLAGARQLRIDQMQSINTFFSADEKEEYIASIHQLGFEDENVLSLYYMRSKAGIQAARESTCVACEA